MLGRPMQKKKKVYGPRVFSDSSVGNGTLNMAKRSASRRTLGRLKASDGALCTFATGKTVAPDAVTFTEISTWFSM